MLELLTSTSSLEGQLPLPKELDFIAMKRCKEPTSVTSLQELIADLNPVIGQWKTLRPILQTKPGSIGAPAVPETTCHRS